MFHVGSNQTNIVLREAGYEYVPSSKEWTKKTTPINEAVIQEIQEIKKRLGRIERQLNPINLQDEEIVEAEIVTPEQLAKEAETREVYRQLEESLKLLARKQ